MDTVIYIIIGIIIFFAIGFAVSYVKAKPDVALIITGPKRSRVVIGKGALRIPFFERIDTIHLSLIQTDIKTPEAVPTKEFINIMVDGVANVRIKTDEESIKLAGQIFLSRNLQEIQAITQEILEGNMREIIGQMELEELVRNRDIFADNVKNSASEDMAKMGIEIVNLTIQNFSDKNQVIEDLGVDNIAQIRKVASIAKANADKEVQIATSIAKKLANDARITAELEISQQNTELLLRQAGLKSKSDNAKASADISYQLQFAEETKRVNIATQDAEIAKREREVVLREREVQVQEKMLDATVKKSAEASRYAAEQQADADLYTRTKEAEAKLAEKTREAEAVRLTAESASFAEKQRAIGIDAVGTAEAAAIEKKALAMKKMEQAAVLQLVLDSDVLPKIVEAAASPLTKVDKITMYGEGNSTKLISDIVNTSSKVIDSVKETTGLDLASLLAGFGGGKILSKLDSKKEEEKEDLTENTEE